MEPSKLKSLYISARSYSSRHSVCKRTDFLSNSAIANWKWSITATQLRRELMIWYSTARDLSP